MAPPTHTELIQDALITLLDGAKGSTRQSIWKCIKTKYPEMDTPLIYRNFIVRLKKLAENPMSGVQKHPSNDQRFCLEEKLRRKIVYNKKHGKPTTRKIFPTEATMKPMSKQKVAKEAKEQQKQSKKKASASKKGNTGKAGKKGKSGKG